ncbi:MAG: hypothetical protein AAF458_05025 [Pseudomonadota bacterium]
MQYGMNMMNGGGGTGGTSGPMWDPTTWEDIRSAMRAVVEQTTQMRKVLPIVPINPDATTTLIDQTIIDGSSVSVASAEVRSIGELFAEFKLNSEQVGRESTHHEGRSAAVQLTRMMAEAEDQKIIWANAPLAAPVKERGDTFRYAGSLLGSYELDKPTDATAQPIEDDEPEWGRNMNRAATSASAILNGRGFYSPFKLVLSPGVLADANVPLDGTFRQPLAWLPADISATGPVRALSGKIQRETCGDSVGDLGLLIATGAYAIDLVMPFEDYQLTFQRIDADGQHVFRITHRFGVRLKRNGVSTQTDDGRTTLTAGDSPIATIAFLLD